MNKKWVQFSVGFLVLFCLYHAAEYFVVFRNNAAAFLSIQFCFFVSAFFIAKWQGFKGLGAWALKPSKGWLLQFLTGMLMGIALYATSFYLTMLINGQQLKPFPPISTIIKPLALFAFGSFFSSLSEDILTWGYLFRHIRPKVPSGLFIAVCSLVYVLNHIYRLREGGATIGYLFLLGVLFAIPLVFSERLWFTTGMHWLGNVTFFFCTNVLQTTEGVNAIGPNTIFMLCILFLIPIQYLLFPKLPFMQSQEKIVLEALKGK